jgi:MbtH protein
VTSPFDDADRQYLVLKNVEGQYSLWPDEIKIPDGWPTAFGPADRHACLEFIEETWLDMRPTSLVREMNADRDHGN